jgi:hypothetical protein
MSSGTEPRDSPSVEHLTPEEASRIIHSHRKVRYGKWAVLIPSPAASGQVESDAAERAAAAVRSPRVSRYGEQI